MSGKPMDRRRRRVRIPIGIEKVLCAAAGDREFREQLLMARSDALTGTPFAISAAEAMILKSVSEPALRTMIESIDLKRHRKRRFFRGIAAASLAATTAVLGTQGCVVTGATIETDTVDTVDTVDGMGERGMLADEFTVPEVVDTAQPPDTTMVGSDTVEVTPNDVQDVDVEDMQVYAGIPPMDVNELDVDVQPMPAGIPPMDVSEE
ncbi:MAG: hypothetical protein ABIK09_15930 [Pseudomonadota bacterium]